MPAKKPQMFIRIGAIKAPVYCDEKLGGDSPETFGEYSYNPPKITHNGILDKKVQSLTLFHEAFHFMSDVYCLNLTEEQVQKLEILIPQLIRDNYKLFKPLFEE